ncbi:MmgE/PrpD family protein [Rhodococcus sp. IEGM 1379]|uniref:MmgE/PrpD family protein n=1 Tax=Rhodococcus sp. IEGM 1379 TaxID=3047086 RepID=UPI0024B6A509|nr:MmgE/PrpD family protein [Rhodococcus sp. IEGM 1379]MDI9915660.1 MmgE/PrpD family protein [Rhodococcus sp. IEGM 1379]
MIGVTKYTSAQHVSAVNALAETATALRGHALPRSLEDRVSVLLQDLFAVTVAGARTGELRELTRNWVAEAGETAPLGSAIRTNVETATVLDAIASCALELDEGNKYAAGHPAAHVVPAAIAAVRLSKVPVSGRTFLTAVVAGYEVASRFGYALTRNDRWHTHGHWGATGAAAAAAMVWNADVDVVAAAIDGSSALIHVAPWALVLDGNFARNLWIAGAVRAGLDAARLAAAGLVHNSGAIEHTLGDIVGSLDLDRLTEDLGRRWLTLEGYAKQHASCSYTHAAIDTVQSLRAHASWTAEDVEHVHVQTHSLAEPLFGRRPSTRLGAMFSLPFVVAASFVADSIDADTLDPAGGTFEIAEQFSKRVTVATSIQLDALLPQRRVAQVQVELRNGEHVAASTPNPVGDVDHFPMDRNAIRAKSVRLIGEADASVITEIVDKLAASEDVASLIGALRSLGN